MTPDEMFRLLTEAYKSMKPTFSQRQQETLEKQCAARAPHARKS